MDPAEARDIAQYQARASHYKKELNDAVASIYAPVKRTLDEGMIPNIENVQYALCDRLWDDFFKNCRTETDFEKTWPTAMKAISEHQAPFFSRPEQELKGYRIGTVKSDQYRTAMRTVINEGLLRSRVETAKQVLIKAPEEQNSSLLPKWEMQERWNLEMRDDAVSFCEKRIKWADKSIAQAEGLRARNPRFDDFFKNLHELISWCRLEKLKRKEIVDDIDQMISGDRRREKIVVLAVQLWNEARDFLGPGSD